MTCGTMDEYTRRRSVFGHGPSKLIEPWQKRQTYHLFPWQIRRISELEEKRKKKKSTDIEVAAAVATEIEVALAADSSSKKKRKKKKKSTDTEEKKRKKKKKSTDTEEKKRKKKSTDIEVAALVAKKKKSRGAREIQRTPKQTIVVQHDSQERANKKISNNNLKV
ncbi:hypothetical protein TSUD_132990 [Trifolium subterraneum]|uniref:Uncharacterized protein n=1 Tax=Trifolium subterraneum TaxID=3900 RepID=A0A2Z6LPU1_TRISU|nr:hypothetical protein TSUD_132990 [Trifolium subterraneum]